MLGRLILRVSFPAASCGEPAAPQWWNWLQIGWFALKETTFHFCSFSSCLLRHVFFPPPNLCGAKVKREQQCCLSSRWRIANHIQTTFFYFCFCVLLYYLFILFLQRYIFEIRGDRGSRSRALQVLLGKILNRGKKW